MLLPGCHAPVDIKSSASAVDDAKNFQAAFLRIDSNRAACYESKDFAPVALEKYTIADITKRFMNRLACTKNPVINTHNRAIMDTVYTFSNSGNKIRFYRARQKDFIFIFDVTDPDFKLTGDIRPGMRKDLFFRKFQIRENTSNRVQIANISGTMRFNFYFQNNLLKRINCYLYLD